MNQSNQSFASNAESTQLSKSMMELEKIELSRKYPDVTEFYTKQLDDLAEMNRHLMNQLDECFEKIFLCSVMEKEMTKVLENTCDIKLKLNHEEKTFGEPEKNE